MLELKNQEAARSRSQIVTIEERAGIQHRARAVAYCRVSSPRSANSNYLRKGAGIESASLMASFMRSQIKLGRKAQVAVSLYGARRDHDGHGLE